MPDTPTLLAALARQAAADPESPFLFWPEGWNWRWWSWRRVAELAGRWSAPLAGLPAGAGVGFAGDRFPEAVALDLAVQAAGLTPLPLTGSAGPSPPAGGRDAEAARQAAAAAGCQPWLEVVAGEARMTRLEEAGSPAGAGGLPVPDEAGAAGLVVAGDGGSWRRLSQATLLAAVAAIDGAVATAGRRRRDSRDREVLVAGRPLQEWAARLLAAWATVTGAALMLESDPAHRLGAVLWARPTVFHGDAAEIAALRRRLEAVRRRPRLRRSLPPAPPLGRLRTLFQTEAPAPDDVAFWQQRGARLLRLPPLDGPEPATDQ